MVVPLAWGTILNGALKKSRLHSDGLSQEVQSNQRLVFVRTNFKIRVVVLSEKSLTTGSYTVDFHDGNGYDCHGTLPSKKEKGSPL